MSVIRFKDLISMQLMHVDKLSAFGRSVKLLTVRYPALGLHSARFHMLTARGIGANATKVNLAICQQFWISSPWS